MIDETQMTHSELTVSLARTLMRRKTSGRGGAERLRGLQNGSTTVGRGALISFAAHCRIVHGRRGEERIQQSR